MKNVKRTLAIILFSMICLMMLQTVSSADDAALPYDLLTQADSTEDNTQPAEGTPIAIELPSSVVGIPADVALQQNITVIPQQESSNANAYVQDIPIQLSDTESSTSPVIEKPLEETSDNYPIAKGDPSSTDSSEPFPAVEPTGSVDSTLLLSGEATLEIEKEEPAASTSVMTDNAEEELIGLTLTMDSAASEWNITNEELLNSYAEQALASILPGKALLRARKLVGGQFTGAQRQIYDFLSEKIQQTASGSLAQTIYRVDLTGLNLELTASSLGYSAITNDNANEVYRTALIQWGIDRNTLLSALLADYPYEMYWFDKTLGFEVGPEKTDYYISSQRIKLSGLTYYFHVSQEYASEEYTVNSGYAQQISAAVSNAQTIASNAASLPDLKKLDHFRQEICRLVRYNTAVAGGSVAYGNPWQLIWVFDGDSSTNVVCEGYAKAFQYLCDLSSFQSSSICCYSVTGIMHGGTGSGGHMWNIVTLDDGRNYLVDITNCDSGSVGYPDELFLKSYDTGSVQSGYTFLPSGGSITYLYDEDTLSVYTTQDLTISASSYGTTLNLIISNNSLTIVCGQSAFLSVSGNEGFAVHWTSSDSAIVQISQTGMVTGMKVGTATISAVIGNSAVSCEVSVLFRDVTDSSAFWYSDVYRMFNMGIVAGFDNGTFRPMDGCNRAAVVTFLWRIAGKTEPTAMANFSDMTGNSDFDKAISWAANVGITTGWDDGTFRPWNICNRSAIVTFLWRFAGKPDPFEPARFTDMTGNSDFDKAISWAANVGITTGWDDGTFRPWNDCTRMAIVSFLGRYIGM